MAPSPAPARILRGPRASRGQDRVKRRMAVQVAGTAGSTHRVGAGRGPIRHHAAWGAGHRIPRARDRTRLLASCGVPQRPRAATTTMQGTPTDPAATRPRRAMLALVLAALALWYAVALARFDWRAPPYADQAAHLSMALSLAHDGDLEFARTDLD